MNRSPRNVRILYLRPPDRRESFVQRLILDTPEVKVTLAQNVPFDPPIRIQGEVVLEKGSDAVWFTFPGSWHDIGRFHRADGTFTGIYANILTPPIIRPGGEWETTDLFLDVWINPQGYLALLERDPLEEAENEGWISSETAARARAEAAWIREEFEADRWPPAVVHEWTLDRARRQARRGSHDGESG